MKSKLTTWMLLTGALLLGGFILVFERGSETSRQQEQRTRTVFNVYPDSLDKILLERGGVQIECIKVGGVWRLSKPVDAPVDTALIEKMIAGMTRVERGELISGDTLKERSLTPADYGFDEPRARISFKNSRGTFTWLIGRDAPLGNMLYVMSVDSGDIISAPQTLLDLVPQDPSWIRGRILFSGEISMVRGLDLRRESGFLQLRQSGKNNWLMRQPHTGRADLQAVHALIEKLFSARIKHFITDEKTDLTVYGLEKPAIALTLFTQGEHTQTLMIGKTVPENPDERYAKRVENDSVFTVSSIWAAELEIDAGRLRSRRLTNLQSNRILSVKLTRGEQQVEMVKSNGLWQITSPARWNTDPERVNELIRSLTEAPVQEFFDAPTDAQSMRIKNALWEAVLATPDQTCTLRFSAPDTNDVRLVRSNDEPLLYAVPANTVREPFADPLFYRNRTVLEINPSSISQITVHSETGEETVCKSADGSFISKTPGRPVVTTALTDLVWLLNDFQVERYETFNPDSLDPYGLNTPQTKLTVTLEGTNAIGHVVLVGSETEDGFFAMLQGQNTVFVLSKKTVEVLTRNLTGPPENMKPE
jgi:hypothetical protein